MRRRKWEGGRHKREEKKLSFIGLKMKTKETIKKRREVKEKKDMRAIKVMGTD